MRAVRLWDDALGFFASIAVPRAAGRNSCHNQMASQLLSSEMLLAPHADALSAVAAGAPVGYAERPPNMVTHRKEPPGQWMSSRLRTGLVILILLEAANLLEVRTLGSTYLATASYFCAFEILLAITVFSASFLGKFERHWRGATMALCLTVILSHTLLAIAMDENEQALVALFVIVMITALLVPWSMRWQCALSVAGLVSFIIMSLTGTIEHGDLQRWVILGVTMAFGLCFTALKHNYFLQSEMVEDLRQNRHFGSEQVEKLTAMQTQLGDEHEQASRLATIVNASDDAILGLSHELKITTWNPGAERIYGYSAEEAIGRGQSLFVQPEDLQSAIEICLQLLKTGEPISFEQHGRRKDNTSFITQVSAFAIRGADGEIVGMAGIGRDITKLKETESELVVAREVALAASRAKSEFLSNMSHELRTPMNAILGMADLLSDDVKLNAEQRHYLEIMRSNGDALLHLINDILDLAKIESGKLSLEPLAFDLEELIDKTMATMSVRAQSAGLELTARILPSVPRKLIGDSLRLGQILINLLGNALKFTEKGEVALTVEALGTRADAVTADTADVILRFSILDTGIGIAADKLQTIFGGFNQADASISRRFGGSGLGLPIVAQLAKLMAGSVEVQSKLGQGSTFRVTVALRSDPKPAASAHCFAGKLDGVRILVVDDNATNRLILREALSRAGAEVGENNCGEGALAELARARAAGHPYRLILLDYRMPGMDGAEVAHRVLSERRGWKAGDHDDTLVLMLASEDLNFQLARLQELGLHTYLIKPVRRVEMLETIGEVLSGHSKVHPPALPGESSRAFAANRPLRILLADDSLDNRLLIRAYFKDLPYVVETAEDGRTVIAKFKASPHELVLMDIRMPAIDGLTATRAIRQWEIERGLARTPIIALTASALEEDVKASLAAGCDAHVNKPVRKRVLLEAIRKVTETDPAETDEPRASAPAPSAQAR
jgi:two-component system sensor histidine kinase/response regulator